MINRIPALIISSALFVCSSSLLADKRTEPARLSVGQVVDRIIKNYASVRIAGLEIEKSRKEFAKIESQLGWVLSAQTGVAHDVSIIDSPSDRFDAGLNLGRQYKSGSRFDVAGNYTYEDSSTSFSPFSPNPSQRTSLDLKWRIPFGRGDGNPAYEQGLVSAESGLQAQTASQIQAIDNLIDQAINLYFDAAVTHMRIQDANKSISRTRKLKKFVLKNQRLGLAERKDVLIVQAQLDGSIAQRDNLLVVWSRQKAEINRLIGASLDSEFIPSAGFSDIAELSDRDRLKSLVYERHPQIALQHSQLSLAEADIQLAKDAKENQLDVVLSVGARTSRGDTSTGSISQEEWAGAARLEYLYDLDKRGFDAQLYQSMLNKRIAEQELERIRHDLAYTVVSLVEQIKYNKLAVKTNRQRLSVENKKMDDVLQRYREGRADTKDVIDFENSLNASSLAYENQRLELARAYSSLNLLLGRIWNTQAVTQTPPETGNQDKEMTP